MNFIFDHIKTATIADITTILNLTNNAYRPASTQQTWTHESDLVAGDRISLAQIELLLSKANSLILLGIYQQEIIACVHIEKTDLTAYIGMLCVKNEIQARGIGKAMLQQAEFFAQTQLACQQFKLSVITARDELVQFYLRRGYQQTPELIDYPIHANVGVPKQNNLKLQVLVKSAN